jgi:hypothetical protein
MQLIEELVQDWTSGRVKDDEFLRVLKSYQQVGVVGSDTPRAVICSMCRSGRISGAAAQRLVQLIEGTF